MNNLNESTILLLKAVAELRRQNLDSNEHFKRWVNLCAALTTDLEDLFCERSKHVSKECTLERRKLLKTG